MKFVLRFAKEVILSSFFIGSNISITAMVHVPVNKKHFSVLDPHSGRLCMYLLTRLPGLLSTQSRLTVLCDRGGGWATKQKVGLAMTGLTGLVPPAMFGNSFSLLINILHAGAKLY